MHFLEANVLTRAEYRPERAEVMSTLGHRESRRAAALLEQENALHENGTHLDDWMRDNGEQTVMWLAVRGARIERGTDRAPEAIAGEAPEATASAAIEAEQGEEQGLDAADGDGGLSF